MSKLFRQQDETAVNLNKTTDNLGIEMQTQYYHNRSPNLDAYRRPEKEHLNQFELKNDVLDEIAENNIKRYDNEIMSVHSPTDHSFCPDSKNMEKTAEGSQITNLEERPRRLGGSNLNKIANSLSYDPTKEKFYEFHKLSVQSPSNFPRRTPGFPKVCKLIKLIVFII